MAAALLVGDVCPSVTIPVRFNVVYSNQASNVHDTALQQQIYVLNAAFASAGIQFSQDSVTRTLNSSWFQIGATPAQRLAMTDALGDQPERVLNVYWGNPAGGAFSFATSPGSFAETDKRNGIFIDYTVVANGTAYGYDDGDRLVAAVGEYLGLYPIAGGSCEFNDEVADTPPAIPDGDECSFVSDSCPGNGVDAIENYMSGRRDSCVKHFTAGQMARMNAIGREFRPMMFGVSPGVTPPDCCAADPTKSYPGVCGCGVVEDAADNDGDGAPNCQDVCANDALDDYDADGLCADREAELGSDPDVADTDEDGLSDGQEATIAGAGRCPSPVAPDSDNDGMADGQEVAAGRNPCEAAAPPGPEPGCGGCSDNNDDSLMGFGLLFAWRFRVRRSTQGSLPR